MRHRKTRRPSRAQLSAIGKIDAECRRLGVACCKRPEGIADRTWRTCYELGYIATADYNGGEPLVRVGSHGMGWVSQTSDWIAYASTPCRCGGPCRCY
jgi:hypothetical protein